MSEAHEKPPMVVELEKELERLKSRLGRCEEALAELWDYYRKLGDGS